jgi:AcrR family transcriptional regulator
MNSRRVDQHGSARPTRGRPRDPSVEARAQEVALQIYAEVGLRGLTFDAIAARSGIGKPALYRRWASAEEILLSATAGEGIVISLHEGGSLREELMSFAAAVRERLLTDEGVASIRLLIDARSRPDLAERVPATSFGAALGAARSIVPRAVARGELPEGSSPTLLIELMTGGIVMRVLTGALGTATPEPLDDDYLSALVDGCLEGLGVG